MLFLLWFPALSRLSPSTLADHCASFPLRFIVHRTRSRKIPTELRSIIYIFFFVGCSISWGCSLTASLTLVVSRCSFRFRSQPTDDVAKDLLHLFSHRERSQTLLPTELRSIIYFRGWVLGLFNNEFCSLLNICKNEEVIPRTLLFYESCAGTALFSQAVTRQVSSALMSLTSVFGMGTGGTSSPLAPAIQLSL